jgi:hypothetical protein
MLAAILSMMLAMYFSPSACQLLTASPVEIEVNALWSPGIPRFMKNTPGEHRTSDNVKPLRPQRSDRTAHVAGIFKIDMGASATREDDPEPFRTRFSARFLSVEFQLGGCGQQYPELSSRAG